MAKYRAALIGWIPGAVLVLVAGGWGGITSRR